MYLERNTEQVTAESSEDLYQLSVYSAKEPTELGM